MCQGKLLIFSIGQPAKHLHQMMLSVKTNEEFSKVKQNSGKKSSEASSNQNMTAPGLYEIFLLQYF